MTMRRVFPLRSALLPALAVLLAGTFALAGCTAETQINLAQVRGQAVSLLNLRSYRAYYHEILYFEEKQTVLGFISTRDRKFLFGMDFVLTAGPRIGESFKVSRGDAGAIVFTLPYPEILSIDGREETIRQYINQTYGGDLTYLEIGDLVDAARKKIAADAISRGILSKAAAETERLLGLLSASLGWDKTEYVWEAANG